MNAELHKQLKDICKIFDDLAKYEQTENQVKAHIREYYKEYEKLKNKRFGAKKGVTLIIFASIFVASIAMFAVAIFSVMFFGNNELMLQFVPPLASLIVMVLLGIEIPVAIVLYRKTVYKKKNDKLQAEAQKYYDEVFTPVLDQQYEKYTEIMEAKEKYINYRSPLLNIIPNDYQNYRAVTFFEEVVRTGRADTLKEAMNLYEEQVHRWNLEAQGERMIQQQHYDNLMMQIQLCDIEIAQSKNAATLRSIESMEFYNTFCR